MSNFGNLPIHQKGQKPVKSKPMRNSAKNEDCLLRLDGCKNDKATVCLDHIRLFGIAGMAQKPHDAIATYGCAHCHAILDRVDTSGSWGFEDVLRALMLTLAAQIASGNITCRGDA
jgi:hypothetical protein